MQYIRRETTHPLDDDENLIYEKCLLWCHEMTYQDYIFLCFLYLIAEIYGMSLFHISSHNFNGHCSRLIRAGWCQYSPHYIIPAHSRADPPNTLRHCRLYAQVVSSSNQAEQRKRLVFLGTPKVVADDCLRLLADSSYPRSPNSSYEIVAVVTQPPAPAGQLTST